MSDIKNILLRLGIRPIYSQYFPPSLQEFAELESMLGAKLPPDFREFLDNFGISRFRGMGCVRTPSAQIVPVDRFYGGESPKGHYNILRWYRAFLQDREIPHNLLPFADDLFGNEFCIDIGGLAHGSIAYWEHGSGDLVPCGNSFSDFAARIYVEPLSEA